MIPVSILLADDHELMRDGIAFRIERQPGWRVCGVASTGREAVELAQRLQPDVVVMDIAMAELNGLDAAEIIVRSNPNIGVVILTMHHSEEQIRRAIEVGVRSFLLKTDAGRLLVPAIEAVLGGATFFTHAAAELLVKPKSPDFETESAGRLSLREREILILVAEARTTKEIADRLGASAKTIEAHRANIMRKLRLHSVAELVRYAIRNGLMPP